MFELIPVHKACHIVEFVLFSDIGNPAHHKKGPVLFIGLHLAPARHPYDLSCFLVDPVLHIVIFLGTVLYKLKVLKPELQILSHHDAPPYRDHIFLYTAVNLKIFICIFRYVKGPVLNIPHIQVVIRCLGQQVQKNTG